MGKPKKPLELFQPDPPPILRPSDESVFRTAGLTAEERSELNRARAWFNLREPPTLTPGQIAAERLTPQEVAQRNEQLRLDWLEHRDNLGMPARPPYQGSDTAIVGILVLPDGRRIPIQSRNDPGPAARAILGSQTWTWKKFTPKGEMHVTSVTQTWGVPMGPTSGVTGNIVHIEPWAAAIMDRTGERNAVLLIELPNCPMCANMNQMLPQNSRITVVAPEEAVTFFSSHGGRGAPYQQRQITYRSPPSTEATRQALYRSRLRRSSGGSIDLGRPFSIGRSPNSALAPGRLAGLRASAPALKGMGAGIAGGVAIAFILGYLNSQELQKKFAEFQPLIDRDVASQSDKVMKLLAAGKRAYAVTEILESWQDLNMGPGAGWSPTVSRFQYSRTTIEEQPRDDETPRKDEYGIGSITMSKTIRFSRDLKAPNDLVDAHRELNEGLEWLDAAIEDPFLDANEMLFLSQHKMRLEGWARQLFGPPQVLPPLPAPPPGKPGAQAGGPGDPAGAGRAGGGPGGVGARLAQAGGGGNAGLSSDALRILALLPSVSSKQPGMTNMDIARAYQARHKDYLPNVEGPLGELERARKIRVDRPLDVGGGVKVEDFSRGPHAGKFQQRSWKL
jgi:hypothetical protein